MLRIDIRASCGDFSLAVSRELPLEGITAVFGPNGSGKSTLLRAIAGFERGRGTIALGEATWLDSARNVWVPPHRRPVGYMFQDLRLFPHLDVAGNLGYAARRRPQREFGLDDVVAALDLEPLLGRRVEALSGGERQRVALGRTLLTHPDLLLLDEPLSALDVERKEEILPYLESLPGRFGVPALYVTHSIDEVARLADRVLVLAGGRVRDFGATAEVAGRLDVEPWTSRFEAGVVVEARVAAHDTQYGLTSLELDGQRLEVPVAEHVALGSTVCLRIRARDVALATRRPEAVSFRNVLAGTLAEIEETPGTPYAETRVDLGVARLRARLTRAAVDDLGLRPGMAVFALIKSVSFEPGDG
jgi:molybdate transport system ATP-binding protein